MFKHTNLSVWLVPDKEPPEIGEWFVVPTRLHTDYSRDWQIGQVVGYSGRQAVYRDPRAVVDYQLGDGTIKRYHKDYVFPRPY